ncbi:hypothetical protein [Neisseria yangbaofengii]|uniref:hypothetical protein n=1 Tax=Neisseria yangbaofengii TaxID=2709396 RepID=UPI0013ED660D|nr:hypothetical protein [Neisseria yangbaofengii]
MSTKNCGCSSYTKRSEANDTIGAGLSSADDGFKKFIEKFGSAELAKTPSAKLFGHVSLLIAGSQVAAELYIVNKLISRYASETANPHP